MNARYTPLYSPAPDRVDGTLLAAFKRELGEQNDRTFASYADLHQFSIEEPALFWSAVWDFTGVIGDKGETILASAAMPGASWFPDARLNFAENLLRDRSDTTALVFRGEDKVTGELSRAELYDHTARLAQALKASGVGPGDRVAAVMPNLPETIVIMLAATSIGAVFSSCSPDFGIEGVLDRFGQIDPKVLFTVDGYFFKGTTIDCTDKAQAVMSELTGLMQTVVVPYVECGHPEGTTLFEDYIAEYDAEEIHFERFPFNHPLYILYSSGTTGTPKCIVHGAGGTLLQHKKEHQLHTDIREGDPLFYFTTCGWMMWNWLVSGLASGAKLMLYDGNPFHPRSDVLFDYAAEQRCRIFGTSAKFLEEARKTGLQPRTQYDLDCIDMVLSTGSPLAPEGFDYVYENIGSDLQLASISGGTDIVSCFVLGSPLLPVHRGEIQCAGLGMAAEVWNEQGDRLVGEQGELVCTAPFPSMPVGFWNDPDNSRYRAAYFERFEGVWHHGDYAEETEHGGYVIYGRSDAVLNPGGVRIGTAEIYRQVEMIPEVMESIVIGQSWQSDVRIVLFVKLREGDVLDEALEQRIRLQIRNGATPRHVPAKIIAVPDIPRTRSGKLVELAVRNLVEGREVTNQEAIANPEALAYFKDVPGLAPGRT